MKCFICPRKCGVDRKIEAGFCGCTDTIHICRAAPHFWEEPCLSGKNGSGTVFFAGCQLHCIYCQNHKISNGIITENLLQESNSEKKLLEIFFGLKSKGVHNINLVTPDMYIYKLIPIIKKTKLEGLNLPFVMNCSGYENAEMIKSLEGIIDIYLPDFKYMSPLLANKYSLAKDYPDVAKYAIDLMVSQQPECIFDSDGILQKGVIVRHMILPGNIHDSKKIISYLHEKYGNNIYISIMNQYTPVKTHKYKELIRKVAEEEYEEIISFALNLGIENSYIQEGEAADESFIPDFSEKSII